MAFREIFYCIERALTIIIRPVSKSISLKDKDLKTLASGEAAPL
jgi:hypothetical protein